VERQLSFGLLYQPVSESSTVDLDLGPDDSFLPIRRRALSMESNDSTEELDGNSAHRPTKSYNMTAESFLPSPENEYVGEGDYTLTEDQLLEDDGESPSSPLLDRDAMLNRPSPPIVSLPFIWGRQ